jgi:hypothetical protein
LEIANAVVAREEGGDGVLTRDIDSFRNDLKGWIGGGDRLSEIGKGRAFAADVDRTRAVDENELGSAQPLADVVCEVLAHESNAHDHDVGILVVRKCSHALSAPFWHRDVNEPCKLAALAAENQLARECKRSPWSCVRSTSRSYFTMLTRRRRSGSRPPSARAASAINAGSRQSADIAGARSRAAIPNSIATQRLDQTRLGGWQQFREHGQVSAAGGADFQRCVHIDADHVPARGEPQLALAGQQNRPCLVLLAAD